MRYQGRLVEWHDDKGYGFIQPLQEVGGNQLTKHQPVFLHIKAFAHKGPRPLQGCLLEYVVSLDSQGRLNAQQVNYIKRVNASSNNLKKISETTSKMKPSTQVLKPWQYWLMVAYAVFLLALVITGLLPAWFFAVPVLMGVVTYTYYMMDKTAAKQGTWRVQESTLHLLSLLGGWCGALIAQQSLRHKTVKADFKRVFWITVGINWLLVVLLSTLNLSQLVGTLF